MQVNDALVISAISRIKGVKSDGLFDFRSDMLIHAPPQLTTHLVNMFKCFLVHGYIPHFLLLCTIVPILKDSLGDIASSDN